MNKAKKLAVLEQLRAQSEAVSLRELLALLPPGFAERSVRRWLSELEDERQVAKTGRKRGTRYRALADSSPDWLGAGQGGATDRTPGTPEPMRFSQAAHPVPLEAPAPVMVGAPGQAEQGQRRLERQSMPPRPLHPLRKLEAPSGFRMAAKVHPNSAVKSPVLCEPRRARRSQHAHVRSPICLFNSIGCPNRRPGRPGRPPQKVRKVVIPYIMLTVAPRTSIVAAGRGGGRRTASSICLVAEQKIAVQFHVGLLD